MTKHDSPNYTVEVATAKEDILKRLESEEFDTVALANMLAFTSRIEVTNLDDHFQEVKISKACTEGSDIYYSIEHGDTEKWSRCVFHRVTIRVNGGGSYDHTTSPLTKDNRFVVSGGQIEVKV